MFHGRRSKQGGKGRKTPFKTGWTKLRSVEKKIILKRALCEWQLGWGSECCRLLCSNHHYLRHIMQSNTVVKESISETTFCLFPPLIFFKKRIRKAQRKGVLPFKRLAGVMEVRKRIQQMVFVYIRFLCIRLHQNSYKECTLNTSVQCAK